MTFSNIELNKLKTFYKNKKEKFAKQINYTKYSYLVDENGKIFNKKREGNPYGEYYGYELREPYSLNEVEKFEEIQGIKLDIYFKEYLTKISREMFTYAYPEVICLPNRKIKDCTIPEGEKFCEQVLEHHVIDCNNNNCDNDDCDNDDCDNDDCWIIHTDSMLYIAEGGCSFSHQMIVKGNNLGTIWHCDGDYINKIADSFKEYIFRNVT